MIDTIGRIVFGHEQHVLSDEDYRRVKESYSFLKKFSKDKVIYGINTGFGPMAQYRVGDDVRTELQYNIIRSHSAGTGAILPSFYVRAILMTRLSTFVTGFSGVHPSVVELIAEFINRDINPVVFEHGSVGASGDLVQLAHIALALIGEGDVMYQGERQRSGEVMRKLGLQPIQMHLREGLALLNGTSAMTGIGIVNLIYAKRLMNWALAASAMMGEITASFDDYFSKQLNEAKLHPGQEKVAAIMRSILSGSNRIRSRNDHFYDNGCGESFFSEKVQEHYSLRCVPQILGPVMDELEACREVLENEYRSASDNPIVDVAAGNVFHGGNFHGDYISFQMDKLKIAITRLAMLAERQMNYLFNDKINGGLLPPFGNLGVLGLNYGLQACQFTATSTTAECQTLSFPNYIHSIPNNNDNQDIVSMGTNSALIARTVIENAYQVMAIHYMAIVQAVDALGIEAQLSPITREIYGQIRAIFPVFTDDTPKYGDIARITEFLKSKTVEL